MSRYGSNFREPPWVYGPKETFEWAEASQGGSSKKKEKNREKDSLNNLHIRFDFDVEKKEIKPPSFIAKVFGGKYFEEDFELLPTAELILRGLAKAKFRNTAKLVVDGKTFYDHPDKKSDLRDLIKSINEFSDVIKKGKNLEIDAYLSGVDTAKAIIKIFRIHSEKNHSVDILIKGRIRKEIYNTFLNYLKENIGLKEK